MGSLTQLRLAGGLLGVRPLLPCGPSSFRRPGRAPSCTAACPVSLHLASNPWTTLAAVSLANASHTVKSSVKVKGTVKDTAAGKGGSLGHHHNDLPHTCSEASSAAHGMRCSQKKTKKDENRPWTLKLLSRWRVKKFGQPSQDLGRIGISEKQQSAQ